MKLKITGIDMAIKKIEKLKDNLSVNLRRAIEKLGEIGVEVARAEFSGLLAQQYDGINDVIVDNVRWVNSDKLEIVARGQAVAFLEFGTGITYEEHPLNETLGHKHGTYGQGKGRNPSWAFYGDESQIGASSKARVVRSSGEKGDVIVTDGNPPVRAMYQASEAIKNQIVKIVKEELFR